MPKRWRKPIGSVGVVAFVAAYAFAASWLGGRLPDVLALRLAFYAIAGIGWGVPILPLLTWMNRGE